ncbi:hypothetical protein [Botrimarina mediterranea]|uniref:Uncharacterized protein n=1 Tax=Botrimarina mediterranea TaxID=2528022 RepID=A0A518K776_9BACT|nr:hypothetical protein [Botrimarina mediterranea]QDV73651.1 hypothetical protein Spa11_18500 [Botrimarina mediterranea]QDV78241.1 hypothetical protein K2D_18480 [Planctomycetes bacterium K2D]
MPPIPTRIRWMSMPLNDTNAEHQPDRVVIDGVLTLFDSGAVVIHDRWFEGNWLLGRWGAEAVDYAFPGGHAFRDKDSNRLIVRTAGPDRRSLVYKFCGLTPFFAGFWVRLVPQHR